MKVFEKVAQAATCVVGLAAAFGSTNVHAAADVGAEYGHAHERIEIGSGRKLNLYCAGHGSPTVIFDSAYAMASWDWALVHPKVAERTRACVYDRAGLGFSDPSPRPGTSANAVDDLHHLLQAAHVQPPYVLVGSGLGGIDVQLYTYSYPQEVRGLVLVDATHEDESARADKVTDGVFSKLTSMTTQHLEDCTAQAHAGFAIGTDKYRECTFARPQFGSALSAAVLDNDVLPRVWDATLSEWENIPVSAAQLRAARKPFGSLPLVYLTRGISPYQPAGKPQSAMNKALEAEIFALHAQTARLSACGTHRKVAGAGSDIQIDRPEAVVTAIEDVLQEQDAARNTCSAQRSTPQANSAHE